MKISVGSIKLPNFQIREELDEEHVKEIRESFKEDGQWNPIIVRPLNGTSDAEYEVISGAHRLSAARDLDWVEIDAIVKDLADQEARGLAIKTNRMQKEMKDEEVGELCKELYNDYGLDEEEIGEITGMSPRTVQDKITLVMDLADPVYELVKSGDLAARKGLVVATLPKEDQMRFVEMMQEEGWSRDEARAQLDRFQNDTVVTVGYSGKDFDELVDELKAKDVEVLVDVRASGESMYKPNFNTDVLENQFENIDEINYVHRPDFGVPQLMVEPYKEQAIGHKCFSDWYNWHIHSEEDKLEEFADFLKNAGKPALMCIEEFPEPEGDQHHYCHRHHLANELIDEDYFRHRQDI
ncbi:ParB/RepB/Spo0J family partition protein [Natrialba asiatica]|uniref:ParB domain protein n=1 Tax=Natrialba asiatica (strain ATCC 700177 / DSM 12278 / JCM 9576 / FERM P-10747 / NBRC 102637 / 172P1) TaxID=29540 RepID=M0AH67_NATA1|nr:ParB/RepB/Spo0J family partition protein [Natrialba asiatica]ELY97904.1 ParB domain protein [Natrialba asiatica DSM 12278]